MVERVTLPSGLRVVTEHIPHVRSVSIGFWLRAGSRYEAEGEHGISHFIEHLLFKGTHTRSARDLAEAIDAAGGQLNAFTAREMTCYYARVPERRAQLAVELLADMLVNPRLDEKDIEKEKSVVLEEIRMYEDSPEDLVHELFNERAFGCHPLSRSVLGTEESVARLSRQALVDYMAQHYTSENLVVSVAGYIDHQQVLEWVETHLAALPSTGGVEPRRFPAFVVAPRTYWREKDIEQVHICLGGPGLPRGDERRFALHVLDVALGGGMSSRLFQELREERGLVYSVYSFHNSFGDAGLFGVYAATSPHQVPQVLDLIRRELERVRREGLREEELERAKEQLKGSFLLSLENTSSRMSRLAKRELFGERLFSPDELVEQVDRVRAEEVAELAEQLLRPEVWTCVAVGPALEGVLARLDSQWEPDVSRERPASWSQDLVS